jgi:hypothetical protein
MCGLWLLLMFQTAHGRNRAMSRITANVGQQGPTMTKDGYSTARTPPVIHVTSPPL